MNKDKQNKNETEEMRNKRKKFSSADALFNLI